MSEMYWKVKAVGKPHLAHGYAACGFLTKQYVLVGCSPKIMFQSIKDSGRDLHNGDRSRLVARTI